MPRALLIVSAALVFLGGCATPSEGKQNFDRAEAISAKSGFGHRIALYHDGEIGAFTPTPHGYFFDFHGTPWASVTKQVIAVMVMQQVEDGVLDLDAPASEYIAGFDTPLAAPTLRQLLQHRSGLRNPDDSAPSLDGFPSFYSNGPTGVGWCLEGRRTPPESGWSYNNCDYIVLGAVLESHGSPIETLFRERIAEPAEISRSTGFLPPASDRTDIDGRVFLGSVTQDWQAKISRYGASGSLYGYTGDILRFDRALMEGKLLGRKALATLWDADPSLGFMALGQWVFKANLKGCEGPVRIVERRGSIGPYSIRNFILPDLDSAMVLSAYGEDYDFGEIWTGEGKAYLALSVLACE